MGWRAHGGRGKTPATISFMEGRGEWNGEGEEGGGKLTRFMAQVSSEEENDWEEGCRNYSNFPM